MSGLACGVCGAPYARVTAAVDPQTIGLRLTAQCGHTVPTDAARTLWAQGHRWTLPEVTAAALAAAERDRQITDEGYTPDHDAAAHNPDDLRWAAWSILDRAASGDTLNPDPPAMWPWDKAAWKTGKTPLRMKVIATGLMLADIDRDLMQQRREGDTRE